MKKIICVFILLSSNSFSQTFDKYELNGLLYSGYKINELKQGLWIAYHNSSIISTIQFMNDTVNGPFIKFDTTGRVSEIIEFKMGNRIGLHLTFYDSMRLKKLSYYDELPCPLLNFPLPSSSGYSVEYFKTGNKKTEQIWPTKDFPKYCNSIRNLINVLCGVDFVICDTIIYNGSMWFSNGKPLIETEILLNDDSTIVKFNKFTDKGELVLTGRIYLSITKTECIWVRNGIWTYFRNNKIIKTEKY